MSTETPRDDIVDVLRAHQWDHRAKGCACGWSQKRALPRGEERLNHPHHVADALRAHADQLDTPRP